MSLYTQLSLKDASEIIKLANIGLNVYKIANLTKISRGKINRCLDKAKIETIIKKRKPWAETSNINVRYSFNVYKNLRVECKNYRSFLIANECEVVYQKFINFVNLLYKQLILGVRVKRSVDEYIKEFKKAYPTENYPRRSWVYKMAKSEHYSFKMSWLPSMKPKYFQKEQVRMSKYNSIENRDDKNILRQNQGNFEIDSVIGKTNDKTALLTLIDIKTGDFYCRKYDRTAKGFKNSLASIISSNKLKILTLTMDNGSETKLLHELLPTSKLFNCHAYCSGEKGTLENRHRIVRRLIPKYVSLDKYKCSQIAIVQNFVNKYYSKKFNRL